MDLRGSNKKIVGRGKSLLIYLFRCFKYKYNNKENQPTIWNVFINFGILPKYANYYGTSDTIIKQKYKAKKLTWAVFSWLSIFWLFSSLHGLLILISILQKNQKMLASHIHMWGFKTQLRWTTNQCIKVLPNKSYSTMWKRISNDKLYFDFLAVKGEKETMWDQRACWEERCGQNKKHKENN